MDLGDKGKEQSEWWLLVKKQAVWWPGETLTSKLYYIENMPFKMRIKHKTQTRYR